MFADIYKGKTVWLSAHTGFKGAWLARWLLHLGARVHGCALPEATNPSLFEQLGLRALLEHEIGDVRDAVAVKNSLLRVQPDFVFHLAEAQGTDPAEITRAQITAYHQTSSAKGLPWATCQ